MLEISTTKFAKIFGQTPLYTRRDFKLNDTSSLYSNIVVSFYDSEVYFTATVKDIDQKCFHKILLSYFIISVNTYDTLLTSRIVLLNNLRQIIIYSVNADLTLKKECLFSLANEPRVIDNLLDHNYFSISSKTKIPSKRKLIVTKVDREIVICCDIENLLFVKLALSENSQARLNYIMPPSIRVPPFSFCSSPDILAQYSVPAEQHFGLTVEANEFITTCECLASRDSLFETKSAVLPLSSTVYVEHSDEVYFNCEMSYLFDYYVMLGKTRCLTEFRCIDFDYNYELHTWDVFVEPWHKLHYLMTDYSRHSCTVRVNERNFYILKYVSALPLDCRLAKTFLYNSQQFNIIVGRHVIILSHDDCKLAIILHYDLTKITTPISDNKYKCSLAEYCLGEPISFKTMKSMTNGYDVLIYPIDDVISLCSDYVFIDGVFYCRVKSQDVYNNLLYVLCFNVKEMLKNNTVSLELIDGSLLFSQTLSYEENLKLVVNNHQHSDKLTSDNILEQTNVDSKRLNGDDIPYLGDSSFLCLVNSDVASACSKKKLTVGRAVKCCFKSSVRFQYTDDLFLIEKQSAVSHLYHVSAEPLFNNDVMLLTNHTLVRTLYSYYNIANSANSNTGLVRFYIFTQQQAEASFTRILYSLLIHSYPNRRTSQGMLELLGIYTAISILNDHIFILTSRDLTAYQLQDSQIRKVANIEVNIHHDLASPTSFQLKSLRCKDCNSFFVYSISQTSGKCEIDDDVIGYEYVSKSSQVNAGAALDLWVSTHESCLTERKHPLDNNFVSCISRNGGVDEPEYLKVGSSIVRCELEDKLSISFSLFDDYLDVFVHTGELRLADLSLNHVTEDVIRNVLILTSNIQMICDKTDDLFVLTMYNGDEVISTKPVCLSFVIFKDVDGRYWLHQCNLNIFKLADNWINIIGNVVYSATLTDMSWRNGLTYRKFATVDNFIETKIVDLSEDEIERNEVERFDVIYVNHICSESFVLLCRGYWNKPPDELIEELDYEAQDVCVGELKFATKQWASSFDIYGNLQHNDLDYDDNGDDTEFTKYHQSLFNQLEKFIVRVYDRNNNCLAEYRLRPFEHVTSLTCFVFQNNYCLLISTCSTANGAIPDIGRTLIIKLWPIETDGINKFLKQFNRAALKLNHKNDSDSRTDFGKNYKPIDLIQSAHSQPYLGPVCNLNKLHDSPFVYFSVSNQLYVKQIVCYNQFKYAFEGGTTVFCKDLIVSVRWYQNIAVVTTASSGVEIYKLSVNESLLEINNNASNYYPCALFLLTYNKLNGRNLLQFTDAVLINLPFTTNESIAIDERCERKAVDSITKDLFISSKNDDNDASDTEDTIIMASDYKSNLYLFKVPDSTAFTENNLEFLGCKSMSISDDETVATLIHPNEFSSVSYGDFLATQSSLTRNVLFALSQQGDFFSIKLRYSNKSNINDYIPNFL